MDRSTNRLGGPSALTHYTSLVAGVELASPLFLDEITNETTTAHCSVPMLTWLCDEAGPLGLVLCRASPPLPQPS